MISLRHVVVIALAAGSVGLNVLAQDGQAAARQATAGRVPVLAELFTSEGCSSCPAADDLLRRLIADQPIEGVEVIAISEHVDYWNRLGWRDPFSSARFTQRQTDYAAAIGDRQGSYTPQLVVDGKTGVVGSNLPEVRRALVEAARAPHATVVLSWARSVEGSTRARAVVSNADTVPRDGALRVMAAIVEDNLVTEVTRGENARRRLEHDGVVRALHTIGTLDKTASSGEFTATFDLDRAWVVQNLRLVAFLQDARTHRVVGAGSTDLTDAR